MQQFLRLLDTRVLPGLDAAFAALSIMTADGMPKEVFVEDTIEWIVKLVKWHLHTTVYPHSNIYKGRHAVFCLREDISAVTYLIVCTGISDVVAKVVTWLLLVVSGILNSYIRSGGKLLFWWHRHCSYNKGDNKSCPAVYTRGQCWSVPVSVTNFWNWL